MDKIYRKLNKITVIAMLVLCMTFSVASFTYAYYYDDEDYPEIYCAYWENRTARWDTTGYASKFELRLYRNGHQVITKSTSKDSMYLGQYLSNSGDYYFDVRPYNRYTGWGNWMGSDRAYLGGVYYDDYHESYFDDSYYDDKYYTERYYNSSANKSNVYSGDISYARNQGPTAAPTSIAPVGSLTQNNITLYNKQTITVPEPVVLNQKPNGESSGGKFVEAYGVWHFIYDNGTPATNVWVQYKSKWYYIDMSGIMATGLYSINGNTYFLQTDGSMGVGTFVLDGITHYFDHNGIMIY